MPSRRDYAITDALTMVTNPETDFVTCLTTEEVVKIFGPDNPAQTWSDVNPEFPDEELQIFAPPAHSRLDPSLAPGSTRRSIG